MGLLHVPVDIGAPLPALDAGEMTGVGEAFTDVIAEAALLATRRRNAVARRRKEALALCGENPGAGDDEDGIGHAGRVSAVTLALGTAEGCDRMRRLSGSLKKGAHDFSDYCPNFWHMTRRWQSEPGLRGPPGHTRAILANERLDTQYKKYRWASGSSFAGSQTSNLPSATTA